MHYNNLFSSCTQSVLISIPTCFHEIDKLLYKITIVFDDVIMIENSKKVFNIFSKKSMI